MGTFVFIVYVVLQQHGPTALFFKTTETIQDNINNRDNLFGLTTDLGLKERRPISKVPADYLTT